MYSDIIQPKNVEDFFSIAKALGYKKLYVKGKIKEILREHVKNVRRSYWWKGENEEVAERILKIIKEKA